MCATTQMLLQFTASAIQLDGILLLGITFFSQRRIAVGDLRLQLLQCLQMLFNFLLVLYAFVFEFAGVQTTKLGVLAAKKGTQEWLFLCDRIRCRSPGAF